MSARLRPAEAADRPAILDLWVEAWSAAMPAIDFEARRGWFDDRLDELEAAGAVTIVAGEAAGGLAGFMTLSLASRYLDQLAVCPALQGLGLAGRMMADARRLSPAGLDLHVNQDNPRALRFYEREGFERLEEGVNPRSGLPIWHMRWRGAT